MGWYPVASAIADVLQVAVPSSGTTVPINIGTTTLVINNAGLLALLTVTLPSNPVDGQRIVIAAANIITALTINGGTVKGALSSMSLNGWARYVYSSTADAWFRTG